MAKVENITWAAPLTPSVHTFGGWYGWVICGGCMDSNCMGNRNIQFYKLLRMSLNIIQSKFTEWFIGHDWICNSVDNPFAIVEYHMILRSVTIAIATQTTLLIFKNQLNITWLNHLF